MLSKETIDEIVESMRERLKGDDAYASEFLSDAYADDYPEDDLISMEALERYWRQEWAPENVAAAYEEITGKIEDGKIRLWRHITIPGDDPVEVLRQRFADGKGLGIYWTHNRDQAHSYDRDHSKGGRGYLLEAVADVAGIDWKQTLASYAHPDWVGEDEITMRDDAEVTLVSLMAREGWLLRLSDSVEEAVPLLDLEGQQLPVGETAARGLRP